MSDTKLITVDGLSAVTIASTAEARTVRDALLAVTVTVKTVTDANSAENAAKMLKDAKAFTRSVEAARAAVKAPILDQGKQIDALAKELTTRVEAEASRLSQVLGVWQAEQNRIAEEARRKAWEEEQRIIRQAQEEARAAEEKAAAVQRELERKASVARNAENAARYAAEAESRELAARQAQERRDAATEQAIVQARVSAAAVATPKAAGIATRAEICFEVLDAVALYEAAPYLVSLTVNTAALKAALKGLTGEQKLPGVRHWIEQRSIVR